MSDLPSTVEIHEEGPREGFQIEPGPISTVDKVKLIDALSKTGLKHIQACSFVNPRLVPKASTAGVGSTPGNSTKNIGVEGLDSLKQARKSNAVSSM